MVNSYDLIFMDIQMPNMNGLEATATLRKNAIETPIIALTANAMKGDDEKCFNAGCDGYLTKPINRKKLLEMIEKYLSTNEITESCNEMIENHVNQTNQDFSEKAWD